MISSAIMIPHIYIYGGKSVATASQIYLIHLDMPNISVRFLVDRKHDRVLFAEAGGDFIDVLFSFLTLPLGSIVRLLGLQSQVPGSLESLYKSVEQLEDYHFQTKACKEMLLNPRSAAAEICEDLKIKNIHDGDPRAFYSCNNESCLNHTKFYYTYVANDRCCRCGKQMDDQWGWTKETEKIVGVFVHDRANYIISDSLRVVPISLKSAFSLLKDLGIENVSDMEERVIDVCTEKALDLLRRSLVSKCALTEICFPHASIEEQSAKPCSTTKKEIDNSESEQKININIILNKKNNNVLYAEVGGDFLNQLVSFLTFPLGSVFRLIGGDMPTKSCINNLYSSAESLDIKNFKSKNCKKMVLSPELASYHGCGKQFLKLDEMASRRVKHLWNELMEKNPKLENGGSDLGGGYVEDSRRFLVYDNLHISPLSAIYAIKGVDIPFSDLTEMEVSVGKIEVMSLLSAMLISETVLTDVFSPKPKPEKA